MGNKVHLILGGARSGKSRFAEGIASFSIQTKSVSRVLYVATAEACDDEMKCRIEHHKSSRPKHWQVIEEPLDLAQVLTNNIAPDVCIIVDCLTLWLSNWLCVNDHDKWNQARADLVAALNLAVRHQCQLLLVSNEVGHGIVPLGELSREFVDQAGWLHQDIATIAARVDFIMAGLNMTLKPQFLDKPVSDKYGFDGDIPE